MNRIVIVGNGFDLAHGSKTSYEDFLLDYFNGIFSQKKNYEDELILMKINELNQNLGNEYVPLVKIEDLIKSRWISIQILSDPIPHFAQFVLYFKSEFFKSLIIDANWSNIEGFYFKFLLKEYKNNPSSKIIQKLNQEFSYIKRKLVEYLAHVDQIDEEATLKGSIKSVLERIDNEIRVKNHQKKFKYLGDSRSKPESVVFLNFNYTNTLNRYLKSIHFESISSSLVIPIHGNVNNPSKIIFGYGDETHEDYKFLENQDEDELLTHIKSFYYFNQNQYQFLMESIDSFREFDVYVIGHSLGLSDRILLKTIFEHPNCKAIKLFHRGAEESQFKKRIALSRHIFDKAAMRSKILNYSDDDVFK